MTHANAKLTPRGRGLALAQCVVDDSGRLGRVILIEVGMCEPVEVQGFVSRMGVVELGKRSLQLWDSSIRSAEF